MDISSTRAFYGLRATCNYTAPTITGSPQIGIGSTSVNLSGVDVCYAMQALVVGSGSELFINLTTAAKTGSTAWTAGVQQVETATVIAGSGITTSGNATITVTATGMTGTPKTISVALTTATHTSATLIAAAIATALNADVAYSAMFTATSSGANVITKRKVVGTYAVGSNTVTLYNADIANLNVGIANGTCAGITTAASSTSTTAGVLSTGCYVTGDGEDFEGNAITPIATDRIAGLLVTNASTSPGDIIFSGGVYAGKIPVGAEFQATSDSMNILTGSLNIYPDSTALVTIVVAGSSV